MGANELWCVLGFRYDAVEAWQDAQLASAIERAWQAEGCPPEVALWCLAAADEYAFRWFVNDAAVRLLDCAWLPWRQYFLHHSSAVPPDARQLLSPPRSQPSAQPTIAESSPLRHGTQAAANVTEAFVRDHQRLDALLADVRQMVTDDELERAEHTFHEFDEGMAAHLRIEETLLFPPLERRVGVYLKMVALLRQEHREILRVVEDLRQAFDHMNRLHVEERFPRLEALLSAHASREARVLYPALDASLGHKDRAVLAAKVSGS